MRGASQLISAVPAVPLARAQMTYELALERYPKSVKLLRAYGKFLANIRNDPWRAERYFVAVSPTLGCDRSPSSAADRAPTIPGRQARGATTSSPE